MADWKRGVRRVLYPAYEARVLRRMPDTIPKHVGVMLDGNRRWAKAVGRDSAHGHEAGAANIEPLLGWCDEVGIEVVTLWLLSTDNLNRPERELAPLLGIIADAVTSLADQRKWRIHPVGALDLLPAATAERLKAAEEATRDVDGMLVNVAVGYGGRREIADAVRSLLQEASAQGMSIDELAQTIDVEHIADSQAAGRIDAEKLAASAPFDLDGADLWFCGPPPLREAIVKGLKKAGNRLKRIEFERFEFR